MNTSYPRGSERKKKKKIINLLEHIDKYDDDDDRHRLQIPVHILSHHLFNNNRIHPHSTFVISSEKLSHAVDAT